MAGDITEVATEAPNPPPKKKSLFSKFIVAQPVEPEEGVDFFSRSRELFPKRLEEEERRREKKIVKLERKRSSTSAEKQEPSPVEEKRRRISKGHYSSEEELEEQSKTRRTSTHSTPNKRKSSSTSAQQKSYASPTSLSGQYSRGLRVQKEEPDVKPVVDNYITLSESDDDERKPPPSRNQPIVLDDDDDDIFSIPEKTKPKPVVADPDLSDEEFPELVQQARERERQKTLQREKAAKSFQEQNHTSIGLDDDIFEPERSTANDDPIVDILITSKIPDTEPLLVKRKISQRLKEVRLAWCDRQGRGGQPMAPDVKDSIMLTWRDKVLYDVSTCKSLNLSFDSSGQLSQGDGADDNGKVHLEAWTHDLFKIHQENLAAEAQRELNGYDAEVVERKAEVKKMRLFLRARDMDDFKIKVGPTTTIQKLINAFRQDKDIPDDKEVSLHLDGEQLDPESKMEDTDLEDQDAVEVHIK